MCVSTEMNIHKLKKLKYVNGVSPIQQTEPIQQHVANGDGLCTMVMQMKDSWRTTHGKERGGNGNGNTHTHSH